MNIFRNIALMTLCIIGFSVLTQAQFRDLNKSNRASKLEDRFGTEGKFDWSRVYVGGQFGGSILNGRFNGVVSPEVGYYVREDLLFAGGPTFEFYGSDGERVNFMGGHVFGRYDVFKGLFVHAEYENVVFKIDGSRDDPRTGERGKPLTGLYAGAGLRIANFVSAMVLYNFLEDENDLFQRYSNPLGLGFSNPVIRISFGGNIGGLF